MTTAEPAPKSKKEVLLALSSLGEHILFADKDLCSVYLRLAGEVLGVGPFFNSPLGGSLMANLAEQYLEENSADEDTDKEQP